MIAFFDDAGFILGGWAITFGAIGALSWRLVRQGRTLGKSVPDDDKYWT